MSLFVRAVRQRCRGAFLEQTEYQNLETQYEHISQGSREGVMRDISPESPRHVTAGDPR